MSTSSPQSYHKIIKLISITQKGGALMQCLNTVKAACLENWISRNRPPVWHPSFQGDKLFLPRSLVKIKYCGEPPWPRGSVLSPRPPGLLPRGADRNQHVRGRQMHIESSRLIRCCHSAGPAFTMLSKHWCSVGLSLTARTSAINSTLGWHLIIALEGWRLASHLISQSPPSKHKTLSQCWFDVDPTSSTLAQYQINICPVLCSSGLQPPYCIVIIISTAIQYASTSNKAQLWHNSGPTFSTLVQHCAIFGFDMEHYGFVISVIVV